MNRTTTPALLIGLLLFLAPGHRTLFSVAAHAQAPRDQSQAQLPQLPPPPSIVRVPVPSADRVAPPEMSVISHISDKTNMITREVGRDKVAS